MIRSLLGIVLTFSIFSANANDGLVFCDTATDDASVVILQDKYMALVDHGYVIKADSSFIQKSTKNYVGTGLKLIHDPSGTVIAAGALPGSPADKIGLFEGGLEYEILAIDGAGAFGKTRDEVIKMIIGEGIAGKGVVVTLRSVDTNRSFDRFLERKLLKIPIETACFRMITPSK